MLNETQYNYQNENKKRKIIFILITIAALLCIIITVIIQIKQLKSKTNVTIEQYSENHTEVEIVKFKDLFENNTNMQEYSVNQSYKKNVNKEIVYTAYEKNEKVEKKYVLSVNIPTININNETIEDINKEIQEIFQNKAEEIIKNEKEEEIIYTVEYSACINSNILSIVIKSTLKEGKNAQRVIVKGYNYNISTGEMLDIKDLISIKKLDEKDIQNEINSTIKEKTEQSETLINLGYSIYKRDINDEIYKLENIDNIFYGPNEVIYIIFAYGNNNSTPELDVVTIK